jgi:AraC-like DNA-binding protein
VTAVPPHPAIHTEFETTDPHTAWEFLDRAYSSTLRLTGTPGLVRIVRDDLGPISVDQVDLRAELRCDADPLAFFAALEVRSGWVEHTRGGVTDLAADDGVVAPASPGQEFRARCGPSLEGRVLNLDPRALEAAVLDVGGAESSEGVAIVAFLDLVPSTRRAAQLWSRTVELVSLIAAGPTRAQTPLAVAELTRLVAHTVLTTFPNATWAEPQHASSAQDATPGSIQRAVAYIESSAADSIGLADIAAAARVSPRALQYGFRRHLDTTPMAYVRRVRLSQARASLLSADDATTVAEVAGRWGFYNLGRFAADYRTAYGERPRETLRRQGLEETSDEEPGD